jgi:DNA-binding MarR family transcriptional regulator
MALDDDILRLLVGAHALTRMAALETRTDAPAAQWRTLALLRDHGPQRVGDLARLSRVTQPGMTRLVAQMSDAGLLERSEDPRDSRVTMVSPTSRGTHALNEWLTLLSDSLAPRFAHLDDEDRAALARTADILTRVAGEPETAR